MDIEDFVEEMVDMVFHAGGGLTIAFLESIPYSKYTAIQARLLHLVNQNG